MSSELLNLLVQIPLVGIFIWFVLATQKNQQDSTHLNHVEWREWLTKEREANEKFINQQTLSTMKELRAISEQITALEHQRTEERRELLAVLRELAYSIGATKGKGANEATGD
jgi:hypothetical protein